MDDAIIDRIAFLQEQISPDNKAVVNQTFQIQINILQKAQLDRLDELVAIRRRDLKDCKSVIHSDRIFAELEALEWLQRQVIRHT